MLPATTEREAIFRSAFVPVLKSSRLVRVPDSAFRSLSLSFVPLFFFDLARDTLSSFRGSFLPFLSILYEVFFRPLNIFSCP
jgi:hypothetical protein